MATAIPAWQHDSIISEGHGMHWATQKKAIGYYEQSLDIGKEVYGDRHPDVAAYLNNIGMAWDALGDAKKAIGYYEQSLDIGKEVYGDRHPDVATRLNNIGSAWDALGDPKKAIGYFQQAYDIFRETLGDEHPHTRIVKRMVGWSQISFIQPGQKNLEMQIQDVVLVITRLDIQPSQP